MSFFLPPSFPEVNRWTDAFFKLGYSPPSQTPSVEEVREMLEQRPSVPTSNAEWNEVSSIVSELVLRVEREAIDNGCLISLADKCSYCVFDTETSGMSKTACVIQIAIGFFSEDGSPIGFYEKLWKLPQDITLEIFALRVHGITRIKLEKEGVEVVPELRKVNAAFLKLIDDKKRIVAHNSAFDVKMMSQTAKKHGVLEWSLDSSHVFCTMEASKQYCRLRTKDNKLKKPKNEELFLFLTGKKPEGSLHDAKVDVLVTARSYFLRSERGWWKR